jgi:2'-5' RNA ligase
MRIFIAIPIPEEPKDLKENLLELQQKIKHFGKLKLVERENLHMTLKFLGEVSQEEGKIEKILSALEETIPKIGNFSISLKSLGVFPSLNYVRVIWVGVEKGNEEVKKLQKTIDEKLKSFGFKEDRRFHPHFTLARVKWINDKENLKKILEKYKKEEFGRFEVDSIEIMKSELTKKGPIYTLLKKIYI